MRVEIRSFLRHVCNQFEYTWTAIQAVNIAIWKSKFASHSWDHTQIRLETILGELWRGKIFALLVPWIQAWIYLEYRESEYTVLGLAFPVSVPVAYAYMPECVICWRNRTCRLPAKPWMPKAYKQCSVNVQSHVKEISLIPGSVS